jgi:F0F1-type ATP synthase membrane subunit c/vacuolar-type H+-ATPase subunit K
MIDSTYILLSLIPVILSALGTGIGQGLIGKQALQSMLKQPTASNNISKLCIIGTAVTETAAILGILMSLMLLGDANNIHNIWSTYGVIGIACAVGISGFCAGIASSFPVIASCQSLARQPFLQGKILNLMLITQTLIMTPNIFGLLIALLIKGKMAETESFTQALQLLASGLSIGLGCIGPSIGLSLFAFAACQAIGINKKAYGKILTFTFICEAIIETPVIFSLLISLIILTTTINPESILQGWQFLAAALCIGLSTISPGINSGRTAAHASTQIAYNLETYPNLSKLTMLALAMIDSFTIYGLLVSIIMILY